MRVVFACLIAIGLFAGAGVMAEAATIDGSSVIALSQAPQVPSGELNVDINTDGGGGAWWSNPVWIAIGVIALVVLVLAIALSNRGGTTIIKE